MQSVTQSVTALGTKLNSNAKYYYKVQVLRNVQTHVITDFKKINNLRWVFLRSLPCDQVSNVMSQTMVQKLDGLQVITPLLKSNKVTLQRNAMALIRNFSKNPNLQGILGEKSRFFTKKKRIHPNAKNPNILLQIQKKAHIFYAVQCIAYMSGTTCSK